ncbi:hypothetical protein CPC08DRAFT_767668 [Agrocybe pediades]|nr:hypothetical protein CPC08DRAFT_767668 [Agrocybe pediades]
MKYEVVVKFAQYNDRDKLDLLEQHNFLEYVSARRFSAIKSFGIFELPQKNIWALLMEHGGTSCDKILKTGRRVPAYFKTHKDKFTKALAKMHVDGVLHGNLDQSHLLMNVRGDISWISGREIRGGDIEEPVNEGEDEPASSKGSQKKKEMGNVLRWTTVWSKPEGKSTCKTH